MYSSPVLPYCFCMATKIQITAAKSLRKENEKQMAHARHWRLRIFQRGLHEDSFDMLLRATANTKVKRSLRRLHAVLSLQRLGVAGRHVALCFTVRHCFLILSSVFLLHGLTAQAGTSPMQITPLESFYFVR